MPDAADQKADHTTVPNGDQPAFPVRMRGYDRAAVDEELHQLRTALDFLQADRDRAVARALALEAKNGSAAPSAESAQVSATVQWLIDTAEQDAKSIRRGAEAEAAGYLDQAERLLRQRIDLIEQAQHEADNCRAQAAAEARAVVHDALEQADALLRGLRESEAALGRLFDSGALSHPMPPPRQSDERFAVPQQQTGQQQTGAPVS